VPLVFRGFPVCLLLRLLGGTCLAPEVPPPEFFAGGLVFIAGHMWKSKHPSLVAMDMCYLSWQTTMSSMCK
jgi:hypothetical protein